MSDSPKLHTLSNGDLNLTPDGTGKVCINYNSLTRLKTHANGVELRSDTSTDAEQRQYLLTHQDGTERGGLGYDGNAVLAIRNLIDTGGVTLNATDSGSAARALFYGDPDAGTDLYYTGLPLLGTESYGAQLRSQGNTDAEQRQLILGHQNETARGAVGYDGNAVLAIRNLIDTGGITLNATDSGSVARALFYGDPDAGTNLYYTGTIGLSTTSYGAEVRSQGNTDTENRYLGFAHQNGTERGFIGYSGSSTLQIKNSINGSQIVVHGNDTGGTPQNVLMADPDGDTDLYYNGTKRLSCVSTGLDVRSQASTDTEARYITLQHQDGTQRGIIGYDSNQVLAVANNIAGGTTVISATDSGAVLRTGLAIDADNKTAMYYQGTRAIESASWGGSVVSQGDTDVENRYLGFDQQSGLERGIIGFEGNGVLQVSNRIHGGTVVLNAEDSGGAVRTSFLGDPGAETKIYHGASNADTIKTTTPAAGGALVNNQATATGYERVLTLSDFTQPKVKTANTARASTTVVAADPDLTLTLKPGYWIVDFAITIGSAMGVGGGPKINFKNTGGASTLRFHGSYQDTQPSAAAGTNLAYDSSGPDITLFWDDTTVRNLVGSVFVEVITSTTFAFFWAQVTSDVGDLTVYKGSAIMAKKVG